MPKRRWLMHVWRHVPPRGPWVAPTRLWGGWVAVCAPKTGHPTRTRKMPPRKHEVPRTCGTADSAPSVRRTPKRDTVHKAL
eukprot:scaffold97598_cov33-Tisochrysis_lutea.AAC.2